VFEIWGMEEFMDEISVAAIEITADELSVGDTFHIRGHTTELKMKVDSIQIEHETVETAKKGDSIGVKVTEKARRKDKVYKLAD
jgi:putative protease